MPLPSALQTIDGPPPTKPWPCIETRRVSRVSGSAMTSMHPAGEGRDKPRRPPAWPDPAEIRLVDHPWLHVIVSEVDEDHRPGTAVDLHTQGEPTRLRDGAPLRPACRPRARPSRAASVPTPRLRRVGRRRSRRPGSASSSRRTKIARGPNGIGVPSAAVGLGSSVRSGWTWLNRSGTGARKPPART